MRTHNARKCLFLVGLTSLVVTQMGIWMTTLLSSPSERTQRDDSFEQPDSIAHLIPLNSTLLVSESESGDASHHINDTIREFDRLNAVIAVKIHGERSCITQLMQSLCLLKVAYNGRMNYDHLVFTSLPISDSDQQALQEIVAPAKLTVVLDSKPLPQALEDLTPQQKRELERDCNLTDYRQATWGKFCKEPDTLYPPSRLQYNWQAEFRSKLLWTQPSLRPYKYMMWYDSDAMASRIWERDPIAIAARNNLVIFFERLLNDLDGDHILHRKILEAFGRDICGIRVVEGHLEAYGTSYNEKCRSFRHRLHKIHGFFYVVDLDFFRSAPVQKFLEVFLGPRKFARPRKELEDVGSRCEARCLAQWVL